MIPLVQTTALALLVGLFSLPAAAFEPVQAPAPKPEMAQNCPGLVAFDMPRAIPAALRLALNPDQVRVTYIGHSTFLIESPQLVRIATDYNDYVRPPLLPDIITMNHAHSTHFTDHPDPANHLARSSPDYLQTSHPSAADSRRPPSDRAYATQRSNPAKCP